MNADDLERFRLEIEGPYEKQVKELMERLQAERKRVAAYKTLVASLEKERHFYFMEAAKASERCREFQSEIEANEILTNEVGRLEDVIRELQARLGRGQGVQEQLQDATRL